MQGSLTCRSCVGQPLRRSRRKGWRDRILKRLGIRVMRCHRCQDRSYVVGALAPQRALAKRLAPNKSPQRRRRRRKTEDE